MDLLLISLIFQNWKSSSYVIIIYIYRRNISLYWWRAFFEYCDGDCGPCRSQKLRTTAVSQQYVIYVSIKQAKNPVWWFVCSLMVCDWMMHLNSSIEGWWDWKDPVSQVHALHDDESWEFLHPPKKICGGDGERRNLIFLVHFEFLLTKIFSSCEISIWYFNSE